MIRIDVDSFSRQNHSHSARRTAKHSAGFTRAEAVAMGLALGVLAAVAIPVAVRSRDQSSRFACENHLRQLSVSLRMYAEEHNGELPARAFPNTWISRLKPYYNEAKTITCPSDAQPPLPPEIDPNMVNPDDLPRSYLINGWNDYFQTRLNEEQFEAFKQYHWTNGMPLNFPTRPDTTIAFAEKETESTEVHMDFFQNPQIGRAHV